MTQFYAVQDSDWSYDSGDGQALIVEADNEVNAVRKAVQVWEERGEGFDGACLKVGIVETKFLAMVENRGSGVYFITSVERV